MYEMYETCRASFFNSSNNNLMSRLSLVYDAQKEKKRKATRYFSAYSHTLCILLR